MQQAERSQGVKPAFPLNHQREVVLADGERWRAEAGTVFQPFQAPGPHPKTKENSVAMMVFVGSQAPLNSQNRHRRIAPAIASSRHLSPPAPTTHRTRNDVMVTAVIRKTT